VVNVVASVVDSNRPPVDGQLDVEELSRARRVRRAAIRFGIVAGIGAVVTLLPLLHLCGAATLLIAAPILGYLTYRVTSLSVGDQAMKCPKCEAPIPVKPQTGGWPMKLYCPSCAATVGVSRADPVTGAAKGHSQLPA
jgi:hypothetical protein